MMNNRVCRREKNKQSLFHSSGMKTKTNEMRAPIIVYHFKIRQISKKKINFLYTLSNACPSFEQFKYVNKRFRKIIIKRITQSDIYL